MGQNPLFSAVFLVLVFVIGVAVVLNIGLPAVDHALGSSKFGDAFNVMKLIDNSIREVVMEGRGAKRLLRFTSPGEFEVIPQEDALQFRMQGPQIVEYLSRKFFGDVAHIGGGDVNCSDSGNISMENSYVRIDMKKVPEASPHSPINTNETILAIKQKSTETTVGISNSSIIIDNDPATSAGTGFSELLKKGRDLPSCTAHVFVNSTVIYDVYYTLYSGADFVVADVRHLR